MFEGVVGMDETTIRGRLSAVMQEHRDLDDAIMALERAGTFNQLQVQRMKKRKLLLKDQINTLQTMLVPDIIA